MVESTKTPINSMKGYTQSYIHTRLLHRRFNDIGFLVVFSHFNLGYTRYKIKMSYPIH